MGASISWAGIQISDKAAALKMLGFRDTGTIDECNDSAFSSAALPTGWVVIVSNDFSYFLDESRLRNISKGCSIVACAIEEHVMASVSIGAVDGKIMWKVMHDAQNGIYDLSTSGELPANFPKLKSDLISQQQKDGGANADVDHIFDIPTMLAKSITGYCFGEMDFDPGAAEFTEAAAR